MNHKESNLEAPRRFFVEVDSVLSLIVHRFGYKLPDDLLNDCSKLYHEARGIYELKPESSEVEKLRKTVKLYQDGLSRVAKAIGVTTPLELVMLAENNEENYIDLLLKWIEKYIQK